MTRRANSVQSLEWTGKTLGVAIDEAERRYQLRDLPPCFEISPAARPMELSQARAERGVDIPVLLALVGRIAPPCVFILAEFGGAPAGAALAVAEGGWAGA